MPQFDRVIGPSQRSKRRPTPTISSCLSDETHHLDFFLAEGLSLYLTAAAAACVSTRVGALSPMRAYSSRLMPSGLRSVECFRAGAGADEPA